MHKYTYWENTQKDHQKFWAISIIKKEKRIAVGAEMAQKEFFVLVRKWGKIGTQGQSMEQVFNSYQEAEHMLDTLIRDKESKGYKGVF